MDANKLREYIWQGVRKEVYADKIELYLPFFFENCRKEPLCLTWNRDGVLSDGGRTISELEYRVGNIEPYLDMVRRILSNCGGCKLVGGRIIVKEHFQTVIAGDTQYVDYLGGMNLMLKAIAQIGLVQTGMITKDGTVQYDP